MEDMAMANLIPWNRGRALAPRRSEEVDPFLALHRRVNRLFEDAFRDFDLTPFGAERFFGETSGWPNIDVSESESDLKITAELPGMEEKDVEVELADGVLAIKGEKKTETEDKGRLISERYYGRFERRIPLGTDVDPDKIAASFKNGVLTITLPKPPDAQRNARRIAINT
jgi:HSP20 family protein